jgi:hypothetical protein
MAWSFKSSHPDQKTSVPGIAFEQLHFFLVPLIMPFEFAVNGAEFESVEFESV